MHGCHANKHGMATIRPQKRPTSAAIGAHTGETVRQYARRHRRRGIPPAYQMQTLDTPACCFNRLVMNSNLGNQCLWTPIW